MWCCWWAPEMRSPCNWPEGSPQESWEGKWSCAGSETPVSSCLVFIRRLKFKLLRDLEEKGWEVEVKKGKIHRLRLPDGSLVTEKELAEGHRIPPGSAATRMPHLLLRGKTKYSAGIEGGYTAHGLK